MIPHTRSSSQLPPAEVGSDVAADSVFSSTDSSRNSKSPAGSSFPPSGRSAELSSDERRDGTTEAGGLFLVGRLLKYADEGLGSGCAHEHAAAPAEPGVQPLDLLAHARGDLLALDRDVLLCLGVARHDRRRLRKGLALYGATEQECGDEPVAGDVAVQIDDVARLLPAKNRPRRAQRLDHIAIADVSDVRLDLALLHQLVEPEVRHRSHRHRVDSEREGEDGDDLIAVDGAAVPVNGEHAIAVAVESDAQVESSVLDRLLQGAEIGGATADVDVRPVRLVSDRSHPGAELLERRGRETGIGAVCAVDADVQARQIGAESFDHVLEVAVGRYGDMVDFAAVPGRLVE